MSVLDDIHTMETRIAARLAELQPLVDEYRELLEVAERLGYDTAAIIKPAAKAKAAPKREAATKAKPKPAARAKRKPAAKRSAKPAAVAELKPASKVSAGTPKPRSARAGGAAKRRPGGTRATGEQRRARMLELIRERPGITVPDLSKELGVDPPPLYRVVRKLVSDGTIKKDGKNLTPA